MATASQRGRMERADRLAMAHNGATTGSLDYLLAWLAQGWDGDV